MARSTATIRPLGPNRVIPKEDYAFSIYIGIRRSIWGTNKFPAGATLRVRRRPPPIETRGGLVFNFCILPEPTTINNHCILVNTIITRLLLKVITE